MHVYCIIYTIYLGNIVSIRTSNIQGGVPIKLECWLLFVEYTVMNIILHFVACCTLNRLFLPSRIMQISCLKLCGSQSKNIPAMIWKEIHLLLPIFLSISPNESQKVSSLQVWMWMILPCFLRSLDFCLNETLMPFFPKFHNSIPSLYRSC